MNLSASILSIALVSRLILGALLLLASVSKLLSFSWFVKSLADYDLIPRKLAAPVGLAVAAAELTAGVLLVSGALLRFAGYLALGLFCCFGAAVSVSIARGKFDIKCGCFSLRKRAKIGWHLLFRNLGLAGLALFSVQPEHRSSVLTACLFTVSLVVSLGSFVGLGSHALANPSRSKALT
jgi:uncharacterized membrane protein YphA (DoxX/SURF4 family)